MLHVLFQGAYEVALMNRVVLSYLSKVSGSSIASRLYVYPSRWLEILLRDLFHICSTLNELGFNYVVFKTLQPFKE